ncbi:MAG: Crp/Fnr family transcriptional regulator [Bacteroidota bacterium]|nr:Crp/Fnr family transcriptional regulator [Bacteroidota bacterium]
MKSFINPHILPLINNLKGQLEIPLEAIELLSKSVKYTEMEKGKVLLEEGMHCNELFFLNSGLIRTHYHNENGEEVTSSFVQENEFFTNVKGFVNASNSNETISMLENSCFCRIKRDDYFDIMAKHTVLFLRNLQIINTHRIELEERIRILQNLTAKEKYKFFERNYPKLSNRVQLSFIASFLGIRLETLGRIRKKNL